MKQIIPVASGKGGVGKTLVTANLGIALAQSGKTVILVDLDLGGANLHTCLGIRNTKSGIGSLIKGQCDSLEDLVIPTEIQRLYFIPGDGMLPGIANMPYYQKVKIIKSLYKLTADYIILDLGAGTNFNTLDFFLSSSSGILVIVPEITSILNAYSFLKNAYIRSLYRIFPPESPEREYINEYAKIRIEGGISVPDMLNEINSRYPGSENTIKSLNNRFNTQIIMNRSRKQDDIALGNRLKTLSQKNLGLTPEFTSVLPFDEELPDSLFKRKPYFLTHPEAEYSEMIKKTGKIITDPPKNVRLPISPYL